jgi:thymidylate synthase (FAD)
MSLTPEEEAAVEESRSISHRTSRATVPELERVVFHPFKVLDHGFVRVVDYMGDDDAIVQAARVSYGRGTKRVNEDRGLIRYLLRNRHTTPFEMAEIKLHIKLPIFVARQWVRHRTANINEYSARYSVLDNEYYVPERERLTVQSETNKQGAGGPLDDPEAAQVAEIFRSDAERSFASYLRLLNEGSMRDPTRKGLARELARINLPISSYTQWYWKCDLHNLMHFVKLRGDEHAQYEIRVYANQIKEILKLWVPLTYEAFAEYELEGVAFSKTALSVLSRLLRGENVNQESSGLSPREWEELQWAVGNKGNTG